ncbi:hypothetical protein ABIG06_003156 [Bradyrhizobium sp. USDA 326]|uniref:TnsA endonuclease N-terminal domain-containing protein n=1 Tax=Bradyrhizobium sp. USDA 326 TaxID=3377726 RepID=UPI003C73029E
MTVRDPRRPSRDNYTGQVPMARCGWKGIPFESMIEMDFLVVTDAFLRTLLGIEAQPCVVEYFFDGKHRRWIPDFALVVSDDPRRILVEVKTLLDLYPEDAEEAAHARAKWAAIERAAISAGYGFALYTENEIRVQPRLDNAMMTSGVVSRFFPKNRIQAGIDGVLKLPNGSSVLDLERMIGGRGDGLDVAIHLAWQGLIRLSPRREWDWETTFVRTRRPL